MLNIDNIKPPRAIEDISIHHLTMPLRNLIILMNGGLGPVTSGMIQSSWDMVEDLKIEIGKNDSVDIMTITVIPLPNSLIINHIDRTILTRTINEIFIEVGVNEEPDEAFEYILQSLYVESANGRFESSVVELMRSPEFTNSVKQMYTVFMMLNKTHSTLWNGVTVGYIEDMMLVMI